MLSGFGIGIRLALSEYPGVEIARIASDWMKQRRIESDCAKLTKIAKCRVIEDGGIIHRQIWYIGTLRTKTVCSYFVVEARPVKVSDYTKQWCPECWPGIQQTIDKYLLWKGS